MSPRTEKQIQELRQAKKAEICDAALFVFAQKGYHNASVSAISRQAKISKGLIYNYFKSKEELLKEIVYQGVDALFEPFRAMDEQFSEADFSLFINKIFSTLSENYDFWKLYFSILVQAEVQALVFDKIMEMAIPLFEILAQYYANRGYKNPMAMARLFTSVLDGVGLNYVIDPENYPIDEIKQLILEKFA